LHLRCHDRGREFIDTSAARRETPTGADELRQSLIAYLRATGQEVFEDAAFGTAVSVISRRERWSA
jgi:hypothetical protein